MKMVEEWASGNIKEKLLEQRSSRTISVYLLDLQSSYCWLLKL